MTTRANHRFLGAATAGALLLGSMLALATAGARQLLASPSAVATVNLPRLLENLKEREAKEVAIRKMLQEYQTEAERQQAAVQDLQNKLREAPSDDAKLEMEERIALATLQFRGWDGMTQAKIDAEAALQLQSLFHSIRDAAEALAQSQGYDIVLLEDSDAEFSLSGDNRISRELQVRTQMLNRRTLYVSESVDITTTLIDRMNNAFDAGQ